MWTNEKQPNSICSPVYPCPINNLYHTRYVYDITLARYRDYVNIYFGLPYVDKTVALIHLVLYTLLVVTLGVTPDST